MQIIQAAWWRSGIKLRSQSPRGGFEPRRWHIHGSQIALQLVRSCIGTVNVPKLKSNEKPVYLTQW